MTGMFFAFGILWLYIGKTGVLKKVRLFNIFWAYLGCILLAEIMLSTRIARVISPIHPLFIIVPLMYLDNGEQSEPTA